MVLELTDRRSWHSPAGPAPAAVGGDQTEQEDDRLAGQSSSRITANSSAALIQEGQSHTTLSGVRTMKTTRTTSWNRKHPRPGPRSGSRSSPLYWTGPVGRGRRGGVGSAFGSRARRLGARRARRRPEGSAAAARRARGRIGRVGHEAERYGLWRQSVGGATGSVARPSTTSTPGIRAGSAGARTTFHDRDAPAQHDPLASHDPGIDPDRQLGRQPEHRHAADLHAR